MHKPLPQCPPRLFQLCFCYQTSPTDIDMERIQKSQLAKILMLVLFLALLFLTPLVSSSMRSSYLYFLLNLLIIAVGVEAGFLSAISKPQDERKLLQASVVVSPLVGTSQQTVTISTDATSSTGVMRPDQAKPSMIMEKPKTGARVGASAAAAEGVKSTLKRCKSRPSLFFIGSLEPDCGEEDVEEEVVVVKRTEEEVGEMSKQELFTKADTFIGNFYKQLEMQREN